MSIMPAEYGLYALALFVLFLTPGPVWVATLARTMSGGFQSAWPLAFGVAVGDVLWPLFAIFGLAWVTSEYAGLLIIMKWIAVGIFLLMAYGLFRHAEASISTNPALTRPGRMAGFFAGLMVILGNPKAILFYLGVLPGFFDLRAVQTSDIVVITLISALVPFFGNLALALFVDRARQLLSSPKSIKRLHQAAGLMLIGVAAVIALT